MMSLQFLAPNLAVQLHNYGYTPLNIGFSFGIPAILYSMSCPFIYLLTDKFKKRGLILIGFILITVAMLMIGGTDAIAIFYKNPFFIFLGLCIMGLSTSLCTIPCLPEMLDSISEDQKLAKKYDEEELENVISGLFVTFQSFGEAIGPMMSSILVDSYGFRSAQDIYAAYLGTYCLLYFLTCGMCNMFFTNGCSCHKSSVTEEDMDFIKAR